MSYMQSLENGKNVQAENFSEILQDAGFILQAAHKILVI